MVGCVYAVHYRQVCVGEESLFDVELGVTQSKYTYISVPSSLDATHIYEIDRYGVN